MNVHLDTQISDEVSTDFSAEDKLLVERLVDGEATDEEREKIVYRLDETVDGWRYCALAFLEAQSFRAALRDYSDASEGVVSQNAPRPVLRRSSPTIAKSWRDRSLSAAVGFLVAAVAIGGLVKFNQPSTTPSVPEIPLASNAPSVPGDPTEVPRAPNPTKTNVGANSKLLSDSISPRTVVLNNPSKGLTNVATPCREVNDYDPKTFQLGDSAIPLEVVNHMYNVGGTIDAHRDEYRFPLDDNRVLIVPVDTYDVRSNGNRIIW